MRLRIVNSGPGEARRNMEIDRELIEAAVDDSDAAAVLRWYEWTPPAFSLGYGQKPEDVFDMEKLRACDAPWAKRPTGGAVVFHEGDQSYSLTFPREGFDPSHSELYRFVTAAWRRAFAELGIEVSAPLDVPAPRDVPPELRRICLGSASPGDLVYAGRKIGGSAQRRLLKVWHQQGFILLKPPQMPDCLLRPDAWECALEGTTDLETAGRSVSAPRLRAAFESAIAEAFAALPPA